MAVDPVPFFVGGGTTGAPEHSPEVVRQFIYDSTSGAEGVSSPEAMRVLAMPTPSNKVRVMPGGGLMNNRYAGGAGQSYDGRVTSQTEVTITATGSTATRMDMVILRVLDPQYEGQAPADWNAFQYTRLSVVEGVSASAKTAADLNLPYPAIALARVTIPKSTATITAGMIADLRKVANPLRERRMTTIFPTAKTPIPIPGTANWQTKYAGWPISSGQRPNVDVPSWATHLDIVAHVSGVLYERGNANTADTVGAIRTRLGSSSGTNVSEHGIIIQDVEDAKGRYGFSIIGSHAVPENLRGTLQTLSLEAVRSAGIGLWYADYQTMIAVDWEFSQRAD